MPPSGITSSTLSRSAAPQWPVRAAERALVARETVATRDSVTALHRSARRESQPRDAELDPWQRPLSSQARAALRAYAEWATPPMTELPEATLVGVDLYV